MYLSKKNCKVSDDMIVLSWPRICVVPGHPDNETTLYPYLLRDGETGRGTDLPQERQDEIEEHAGKIGMTLRQAFSLRRNKMKRDEYKANGGKMISVEEVGLGTEMGQRIYAQDFEDRVAAALDRLKIVYTRPEKGPDFILAQPLVINGHIAKWIEVKCFYACASLTSKTLGVGRIPDIAKRYQKEYGPGCIALGQGFHQAFEARMKKIVSKVILLDASDEALQGICLAAQKNQ